jgi:hypothetical protein
LRENDAGDSSDVGLDDGPRDGAANLLFSDDFEDGNAKGWIPSSLAQTTWSVVADGANHALQGALNDSPMSWIAAGSFAWRDQMVTARIKMAPAPDASTDPGCAVFVAGRFVEERTQDYVELEANGRLRIRQHVNGATFDIATIQSPISLAAGSTVTLGLSVRGPTLTAYVNGDPVATGTEGIPAGPASGGIALGVNCATAWFDDVRLEP